MTNTTRNVAVGTVKKSIEAKSFAWLSRKVRHVWQGGFRRLIMYFSTVLWAVRDGDLGALRRKTLQNQDLMTKRQMLESQVSMRLEARNKCSNDDAQDLHPVGCLYLARQTWTSRNSLDSGSGSSFPDAKRSEGGSVRLEEAADVIATYAGSLRPFILGKPICIMRKLFASVGRPPTREGSEDT